MIGDWVSDYSWGRSHFISAAGCPSRAEGGRGFPAECTRRRGSHGASARTMKPSWLGSDAPDFAGTEGYPSIAPSEWRPVRFRAEPVRISSRRANLRARSCRVRQPSQTQAYAATESGVRYQAAALTRGPTLMRAHPAVRCRSRGSRRSSSAGCTRHRPRPTTASPARSGSGHGAAGGRAAGQVAVAGAVEDTAEDEGEVTAEDRWRRTRRRRTRRC